MEKRAISKFQRISASKARDIARAIQGKPVVDALAIVEFSPRKSAKIIGDTLRSAVANAENDENAPAVRDDLVVKQATVDEGPTMKRVQYKARGRAGRINKRTSHVTVIVTDEKN